MNQPTAVVYPKGAGQRPEACSADKRYRPQHQSLFERTGLPPPSVQRSQLHIHVRQNRGNGDLFGISWNGKIVGADLRSCNGQRNDAYRVREHLTEAEIGKMLAALKDNRRSHRDWLIGLVIYRHGFGGTRQLAEARLTDITFPNRTIGEAQPRWLLLLSWRPPRHLRR